MHSETWQMKWEKIEEKQQQRHTRINVIDVDAADELVLFHTKYMHILLNMWLL